MENDKKIIMEKVIATIMETIVMVLLMVGILILIAEDQIATAILAGVGLVAGIGMIINEVHGIETWLDIMEEHSTVIINK